MSRRSLLGVIAFFSVTGMVSSATAALAGSLTARGSAVAPTIVRLANGGPGIGFDDTPYDRATNRIYVPGGRSGNLFEINPDRARSRVLVSGFSKSNKFNGDHDFGITSVSAARGFLFVTDRTTQRLSVVRRSTGSVVATIKLAAGPDIVRYVAAANKLWVTEPDKEQIEVLTGPSTGAVRPRHVAFISVPGGPEALVIDQAHGRAYTEAAAAKTVVINVKTRKVSYGWTSGCKTPKELAIDEQRNLAFTACNEGGIYAVDLAHGRRVVAHAATRGDVDFPAYNAKLRHLYVASGLAKKVSIFAVSPKGGLTRLGTVPGARHGANVLATPNGDIWVPRPYKGDVLRIADPFVRHRRPTR